MVKELFDDIKMYFDMYFAEGMYLILFIISLFYLFTADHKKVKYREILLYYPILMLLVIGNPLVAYIAVKYMIGSVYWRMFWMLPIIIVIAYAVTKAIACQSNIGRRFIALLFAGVIIVISGKNIVTQENYSYPDNAKKLPEAAIAVSDIIAEHSENNAKAIVDEDLMCYIRQYNANIKLFYGRNVLRIANPNSIRLLIYGELKKEFPDFDFIVSTARKYDCNYIVVKYSDYFNENLIARNFMLVQAYDKYGIYYDNE